MVAEGARAVLLLNPCWSKSIALELSSFFVGIFHVSYLWVLETLDEDLSFIFMS